MGQPGPYNVNLSGLEAECQWAKGAFSEKFGRFRAGGSGGMTRHVIGGTDNAGRFGLAQPGIDGGRFGPSVACSGCSRSVSPPMLRAGAILSGFSISMLVTIVLVPRLAR